MTKTFFCSFDHKPLALVRLPNTHSESPCQTNKTLQYKSLEGNIKGNLVTWVVPRDYHKQQEELLSLVDLIGMNPIPGIGRYVKLRNVLIYRTTIAEVKPYLRGKTLIEITKQQLGKINAVARQGIDAHGISKRRPWCLLFMLIFSDYWFINFSEVIRNFFSCCLCGNKIYSHGYLWSSGLRGYADSGWSNARAFHLECLFHNVGVKTSLQQQIRDYIDTFYVVFETEVREAKENNQQRKLSSTKRKQICQEIKRVMNEGI